MMLLCGNYESRSHLITGDIFHDRPCVVDTHDNILHAEHFRSPHDPSVEVFQSDSYDVSPIWRQPGASIPLIFCLISVHDSEMVATPSTLPVTLTPLFTVGFHARYAVERGSPVFIYTHIFQEPARHTVAPILDRYPFTHVRSHLWVPSAVCRPKQNRASLFHALLKDFLPLLLFSFFFSVGICLR